MIGGHHDFVAESAKASPPAAAVGLSLLGVPIGDFLTLLLIIYTACQIYFLLRDKWWRPRKERQGRKP